MHLERELKYSRLDGQVPSQEELAAALEPHGLVVSARPPVTHLDRYYDDARLSLSRAGLALRRRQADGRALATLKTRGSVDGAMHARDELELALDDGAWPEDIRSRVAVHTDPAALHPVLSLETDRIRMILGRADGVPVAELSFDRTEARLPGSSRSVEFHELELEADPAWTGSDDALIALAEPLEALLDLTPSSSTKLERARALLMVF